jgi:hypothetical protein
LRRASPWYFTTGEREAAQSRRGAAVCFNGLLASDNDGDVILQSSGLEACCMDKSLREIGEWKGGCEFAKALVGNVFEEAVGANEDSPFASKGPKPDRDGIARAEQRLVPLVLG